MEFEKAKEFILTKQKNELAANLHYHSYNHVMDVYDAAIMLAGKEGVDGEDLTLLLTAVLFHDSGFTVQTKNHEELGCEIVRRELPHFGYTAPQIEKICGMIMATKIPQTPHNHLEEIICDADLDYLGRDDFFPIGNTLFDELRVYGILKDEEQWNKLQVSFLESHKYFTKTANSLRYAKKQQHLDYLKKLVG
jgi:uncharacterized protein